MPAKYPDNNEIADHSSEVNKNIPFKKNSSSKINNLKFTWKAIPFCLVLLSSLIPFGTFYVDKKYLSKLKT